MYVFPDGRASAACKGMEELMCASIRCPQPLHFVSFDRLGIKTVQAHASLPFEDPLQVTAILSGMGSKGGAT